MKYVRMLLTPVGAGIALFCFFLPWGRFSVRVIHKTMNGAGLHLWGLFWAALLILVAGGVLVFLSRIALARIVTAVASLASLGFLVAQAIRFTQGIHTPVGAIHPEHFGVSPGPGGTGTAMGFVLALFGALLLRPVPWEELRALLQLQRGGVAPTVDQALERAAASAVSGQGRMVAPAAAAEPDRESPAG